MKNEEGRRRSGSPADRPASNPKALRAPDPQHDQFNATANEARALGRTVPAPLEAARNLLSQTRWYLFPCIGKVPATEHGFLDATNDPGALCLLFAARPDADGFGVDCARSGISVLDLDRKPGLYGGDTLSEAGYRWWEADTPRARTPRGGEHVFFSGTLPSRIGVLPGVDVKGAGGYVVLPPAPGRSWLADASPWDLSPVPVPAWLQGLASPVGGGASRWSEATLGIIEEGRRNQTAASIIGHLLGRKVDPKLAFLLLAAWGRAFCDPPLSDRESLSVFRSIAKREGAQ